MLLCLLFLWFQAVETPAQEHARRGVDLWRKGDLRGAEPELREAVKVSPNDAIILAVLGSVLAGQGRAQEAIVYLQKALKIDPTDAGTRYNLAAVQFRLGESRAATANLQRILRDRPDHRPAVALGHEIALAEYRANRFADSRSTLEVLTGAGVRNARVFNLLAWCYHRLDKLPEAVRAMRQAIELEPAEEANYDDLAQILLEQKKNVAAAGAIGKALEVAPNSARVYKLKGRMEMQIGNFNLALESFRRALELHGRDAESLLGLGLVEEKLFQFDRAAATFEKGLEQFPRDARFYEAYGRMLLESGKLDAAREAHAESLLEKALAIDNSLAEAQYQLGKLLLAHGKAAESLPHLEAAAKLNPQNGRVHLALANAYRTLDRKDAAARELKLVKELQNEDQLD